MIGFSRAFLAPFLAGALVAASACGGSVVFVEDGEGGSGGVGGNGTTSTKATGTTSTTKTSSVQQGTTVGPTTTDAVTVSVSTGPSACDTGVPSSVDSIECQQCQECTFGPTGACSDELSTCEQSGECFEYVDCISNCGGPGCEQQCEMMYPTGFQLYWALVNCVLCVDCYYNCDGQSYCGFK